MHGKPLITTACIAFRADERLAHQHGHAVCQPPVPLTRLIRMTLVVSPSAIGPHAYIHDGSVIACIGGKLLSVGSRREGAR